MGRINSYASLPSPKANQPKTQDLRSVQGSPNFQGKDQYIFKANNYLLSVFLHCFPTDNKAKQQQKKQNRRAANTRGFSSHHSFIATCFLLLTHTVKRENPILKAAFIKNFLRVEYTAFSCRWTSSHLWTPSQGRRHVVCFQSELKEQWRGAGLWNPPKPLAMVFLILKQKQCPRPTEVLDPSYLIWFN